MLNLAPFRGTVGSPQFVRWLDELYKQIGNMDVQNKSLVAVAATDLATALTLLNQIRAVLITNKIVV